MHKLKHKENSEDTDSSVLSAVTHADADAQSKLNYDSGMLKVVHYGDDVLGDEIKADLKGDYVAAAGAIAKGQQEADISVIGDKKGGYSQEIIYQPGKFDLGADAQAQAEGQFQHALLLRRRVSLAPMLQPTLDSA